MRVNAVSPGPTTTPGADAMREGFASIVSTIPLGRAADAFESDSVQSDPEGVARYRAMEIDAERSRLDKFGMTGTCHPNTMSLSRG